MNQLTEIASKMMRPRAAFISYSDGDEYYFEAHKIIDGRLGPGSPLSETSLQEMVKKFERKQHDIPWSGGLMPENILFLDQRQTKISMAWYNPPMKRPMYFSKDLEISDGTMWLPGLIFHCGKDGLSVIAFTGSKPNPEHHWYQPPFFNTSSNHGLICMGSAVFKMPKDPTYTKIQAEWERLFFGSVFTHLNGSTNPTKGNLSSIYRKIINTEIPFPPTELKRSKETIAQYLTRL